VGCGRRRGGAGGRVARPATARQRSWIGAPGRRRRWAGGAAGSGQRRGPSRSAAG
jgi:hypothetical protein